MRLLRKRNCGLAVTNKDSLQAKQSGSIFRRCEHSEAIRRMLSPSLRAKRSNPAVFFAVASEAKQSPQPRPGFCRSTLRILPQKAKEIFHFKTGLLEDVRQGAPFHRPVRRDDNPQRLFVRFFSMRMWLPFWRTTTQPSLCRAATMAV